MGNLCRSPAIHMPLQYVTRRLENCMFPEDKAIAMQMLDEIDIQLADIKTAEMKMVQLKNLDGMRIIIKAVKKLMTETTPIVILLQILESIKANVPLMMDFIQFGGLDLLSKAGEMHTKDAYLAVMIPRLTKIILAAGASSSILEIEEEAEGLKLCKCCQETIAKSKMKIGSVGMLKVPKSSDRINRVLRFMENYLPRVDVQLAGLEAVINFARNADAATCTLSETNVIDVVTNCIKYHSLQVSIVWRCCMALATLAGYTQEIAVDIALTNIHEHLMDYYDKLAFSPLAQQQVLWLLGALVSWPISYKILHKSRKTIDFAKRMIDNNAEREKMEIIIMMEGIESTPASSDIKGGSTPELSVVIPLDFRRFYRQTNGMTFKEQKMQKKAVIQSKKRRNFDELPMYGTVEDTLFNKGVSGLVDDHPSEDQPQKPTRATESKAGVTLPPIEKKKSGMWDPKLAKIDPNVSSKKDWEHVLDAPIPRKGALKKKKLNNIQNSHSVI